MALDDSPLAPPPLSRARTALRFLRRQGGMLAERLTWWIPAGFALLFFAIECAVVAHVVRLIFGTTLTWGYLGGILVAIPLLAWALASRRHGDDTSLLPPMPLAERHPVRTLVKQKAPPKRGPRRQPAEPATQVLAVKAWRAA